MSERALSRTVGRQWAVVLTIALVCGAIPLINDQSVRTGLIALLSFAGAIALVQAQPARWLLFFFAIDLLAPPVEVESLAVHPALCMVILGLGVGLAGLSRWRIRNHHLLLAGFALSGALIVSLAPAAIYSGPALAAASTARLGLFLIGMYVFAYTLCAPATDTGSALKMADYLAGFGAVGAAFACVDFYFHFPAPAGFAEQYVWLPEGVFRRAQGLFYDASTLGNACAFFFIYVLICLFESEPAIRRRIALAAAAVVLCTALILSYSRASIVNVAVAIAVYGSFRGARWRRSLLTTAGACAVAVLALYLLLPSFAGSYWSRIANTFTDFLDRPNSALSGRLTSWQLLSQFTESHPWQTVFGIGFKTLPYTNYLGDPVIADNTYLSLWIETGIAGFGAFIAFLVLILKQTLRAARQPGSGERAARARLLGRWAFCFWCGEAVQMLSGDLLTYWRVLPLYLWVVAAAVRASEAE